MGDIIQSLGIKIPIFFAQVVNLLILFFVFKYFVGGKLQKSIEDRRSLIKKLEKADEEYENIILEAKSKSDEIFAEGEKEKNKLINEGKQLGEKKSTEIIDKAEQEAKVLVENAKSKAEKMNMDISKNFEDSVKQTTMFVIKKLVGEDKEISEKYVQNAIAELK